MLLKLVLSLFLCSSTQRPSGETSCNTALAEPGFFLPFQPLAGYRIALCCPLPFADVRRYFNRGCLRLSVRSKVAGIVVIEREEKYLHSQKMTSEMCYQGAINTVSGEKCQSLVGDFQSLHGLNENSRAILGEGEEEEEGTVGSCFFLFPPVPFERKGRENRSSSRVLECKFSPHP